MRCMSRRHSRASKGVKRVLHPALPSLPGHEFFKRDFKGPSGMFSIILDVMSDKQVAAFLKQSGSLRHGL